MFETTGNLLDRESRSEREVLDTGVGSIKGSSTVKLAHKKEKEIQENTKSWDIVTVRRWRGESSRQVRT